MGPIAQRMLGSHPHPQTPVPNDMYRRVRGPKRSRANPRTHPFVTMGLLLTPVRRFAVFGIARTKQHKRNAVTLVLQDSGGPPPLVQRG